MVSDDRWTTLLSYAITVGRGLGAAGLFAVLFGIALLPAAFSGPTKDEPSVGVGLLFGAAASGLLLLVLRRWPRLPAAALLTHLGQVLSSMFLMFAPVPPALHMMADRGTATWSGVAVGIALWTTCWLGFRLLTRRRSAHATASRPE